jgi:hypothetical protein
MRQARRRSGHFVLLTAGLGAAFALGCSGSGRAGNGPGSGGAGSGSGGDAMTGSGGMGGATFADTGGVGGGIPVGPTFVDGTRLVAQTYSFPGTPPLFVGVFDRQEKVACLFRAASDGQLRCLPPRKPNVPDPMPADRWQAGTEMAGAANGLRLRQHRIVGSDGSSFPSWLGGELLDEASSEPCRPDTTREEDGTGQGICLPRHALATGIFFADATCTSAAAQQEGDIVPLLIATPKREVFALGDKVVGTTFIQYVSGGACMEFPAASGVQFYRIGAALPAGTVAPVQIVPRGSGRLMLRTVEFQGAGVAHVRHNGQSLPYAGEGPYYDRSLGMMCRPTWTASAELRCVPDDAYYVPEAWLTNFADPDCTRPVVASDAPTAVLLRSDPVQDRQVVVEVRKVATESTTTAYSREYNTARECREFIKGAGHPLGDVVPLDGFAAVEARTGQE